MTISGIWWCFFHSIVAHFWSLSFNSLFNSSSHQYIFSVEKVHQHTKKKWIFIFYTIMFSSLLVYFIFYLNVCECFLFPIHSALLTLSITSCELWVKISLNNVEISQTPTQKVLIFFRFVCWNQRFIGRFPVIIIETIFFSQ